MARKKMRKQALSNIMPSGALEFSQLRSWKAATVVLLIVKGVPTQFGDMKNQLERSALSICNNIAEACGRYPKGGRNVENLFSSAKGSLCETSNMLAQSCALHSSGMTPQDKKLIEFAQAILSKSFEELTLLINDPTLLTRPEAIIVFRSEEAALLNHVLSEVGAGKEVRQAILEITGGEKQNGKKSVEIIVEDNAPKLQTCVNCYRVVPEGDGKYLTVPMTIGVLNGKVRFPQFFCERCLVAKGKPKEIIAGKVGWIQENPASQDTAGELS